MVYYLIGFIMFLELRAIIWKVKEKNKQRFNIRNKSN